MSALEDRIYDFFFPCLNVAEDRFIEAHADIVRPHKSYVDYQIVNDTTTGVDHGRVTAEGQMPIHQVKTLVVQLNFYGEDAKDAADLFLIKLEMESSLIRGEVMDLGLLSFTPPVDTSEVLAKTWERRQTVRLSLSHTMTVLDDVGLIEHVEVNGDFS